MRSQLYRFPTFVLFLIAASANLYAQCPLTVDAGPNKFVCSTGPTVQLDGSITGDYIGLRWSPTTGLNNPNILDPTATVTGPVTYTLTGAAFDPAAPNLVTNPGFESGNTGFTTSLTYNPTPITPGTYVLTTSPSLVLSTFPPCDDHTFGNGTGFMMLINGSGSPNSQIWCQTIPVMANSWYFLSGWIMVSPISPPTVQFAVNNAVVGSPFVPPTSGCEWMQFTAVWFSGTATSATVCIRDLSTGGNGFFGDDFALDDIFMSKACTVSDQMTVAVATVNVVLPTSIILPCSAQQNGIQLNGSGSSSGPGYSYSWDGPGIISGQNTPVATVNEPGVYTLTVSFDTGDGTCSKSASINVLPDPLQVMAAASGGEELTCAQKTTMLSGEGSSTGPLVSYNWQPAAGVVSGQGTLTPTVNQPGTYTLTVTHNISGCTSTATVLVTQNATLAVAKGSAPGPITCVPGTITLNGTGSSTGPDFTYQWNGPGIVSGANTLNNCVVNTAGVYTLVVTNETNGCTATATVPVSQSVVLPAAVANADAPGALDCTTSSLNLNSTGSSSGPTFTYLWTTTNGHFNGPVNGPTATVDTLGLYILTVTNTQNGCKKTDTVSVGGNFTAPVIVIKKPLPTLNCAADSVRIRADSSSMGPGFSYVWTTPNGHILSGDSTLMPWVDSAGTYIVNGLNAANGCKSRDTVKIMLDTLPPTVAIALPAPLNCLASTVQLDASGSSNGPRIALNWAFTPAPGGSGPGFVSGDTTLMPFVNAPGVYTLSLTDTLNHCASSGSVEVLLDIATPLADAGADAALTCTVQSVVLDGSGSSQGTEFTYTWTGGSAGIQLITNTPGTYFLTVTNTANGCFSVDAATVTEDESVPDVTIETPEILTCTRKQTSLSATAPAGPEFTYLWAFSGSGPGILSGETTLMPTVGSPGVYTLVVTNTASGCTNVATVLMVEDVQSPGAALSVSGILNCQTTAVLLTNTSPADPALLNHAWTNPDGSTGNTDTNPQWSANATGTYYLLLTNTANGCTSTASATVTRQEGLSIEPAGQTNASCFGAADGMLAVTVSGGTGTYTYTWETGQNTPGLQNLTAGTYTLTVTDTDNCSATISLTVQQPGVLLANATATDLTAPGSNDGTATTNPSGGTLPYEFVWSTGKNDQTITGLPAGQYTVTVADANGCTAAQTVEVLGVSCNLSANIVGNDPACHGFANGSATVTVAGGAAPLAYVWSSGATSQTAVNLSAGTYTVSVTDAENCDLVTEITLSDPALLTLGLVGVTNANCPDAAEGTATVAAAGGTGAVSILWNNGQQGPTATALLAGTYTATATDGHGCTSTAQAEVLANDAQPPVIQAGSAPLPVGLAGLVTLTVQNLGILVTDNCTVAGVQFVPASFDCLSLGVQQVTATATDASGNSSQLTFDVTVVDIEAPAVVCPPSIRRCADDSTVGYTAPVATDNCLVLGGQFDLVAGLPSGSQFPVGTTTTTYTFTDASGNVGSCSFEVTVLSPLSVLLDTIINDVGEQETGGVQVTIGGSLPGYTFAWRQNGQTVSTAEDLTGVGAGTYSLLVTDAYGCTKVAGPFVVSNSVGIGEKDLSGMIAVYPNPTTGKVYVMLPENLANGGLRITVFDALGRQVHDVRADGQRKPELDLAGFADGQYTTLIRTEQGQAVCKVVLSRF
ncbi:MAG: HYR domain-containing protein [Saprospiraceae bacterium]